MTRHTVIAALVLVACSNKDKPAEQHGQEQYAKATEQSYNDLAKVATTEPKKPAALPLSASKPRVIDGLTPAAQVDVPEDVPVTYHKGAGKPDEDAVLIDWHGTNIYVTASDGDPASVKKELKGTVEEKSHTDDGWVMTGTEGTSTTVAVYRKPVHALCKAWIAAGNVDDVIAICSTLRPR